MCAIEFPPAPPEDVPCYDVQADTDYGGHDISWTLIDGAAASDCAALCTADSNCAGKLFKHISFLYRIY